MSISAHRDEIQPDDLIDRVSVSFTSRIDLEAHFAGSAYDALIDEALSRAT